MVGTFSEHMLRDSWPGFLDLLDSDTERAFGQFYVFAQKLLALRPPLAMRAFPAQEHADLKHDVVYHFCKSDFDVLRRYRDRGSSFASWFLAVAKNAIRSRLRKAPPESSELESEPEAQVAPAVVRSNPDASRLLASVLSCLADMTDEEKILILARALEFTPLQMTQLLGRERSDNKAVGDRSSDTCKKLKRLLHKNGVNLAQVMPTLGT